MNGTGLDSAVPEDRNRHPRLDASLLECLAAGMHRRSWRRFIEPWPVGDSTTGPEMEMEAAVARRCFGESNELLARYHDEEWGRPVLSEQGIFDRLCLESFQSGLSWALVLSRRDQLRRAFRGFEPDTLAEWTSDSLTDALEQPGVIRNAAKVRAVVTNARATVRLRETASSLEHLVWGHRPPPGPPPPPELVLPKAAPYAVALSTSLRGAGFTFVGPVTAQALCEAIGIVNHHRSTCPVVEEVELARLAALATE